MMLQCLNWFGDEDMEYIIILFLFVCFQLIYFREIILMIIRKYGTGIIIEILHNNHEQEILEWLSEHKLLWRCSIKEYWDQQLLRLDHPDTHTTRDENLERPMANRYTFLFKKDAILFKLVWG